MKIAFLILAHNNPKHFHRLINAISSPSNACFVHIDKKSNIENFSNTNLQNVHFLKKRVKVYRAHFSHVEAELLMIQRALSHANGYDRFILLSGTDYPLHSQKYIEEFFDENSSFEFINITKMPAPEVGKPMSRLYGYNPTPTKPLFYIEILIRAILKRLRIIPKTRDYQKYLGNLIPYAGSEWWALTRNACKYIIDFVLGKKSLLKFYKNTSSPQEMFFQTILGNSTFMENITRNVTFTDWSAGGGHPALIEEKHLTKFRLPKIIVDDDYGKGEVLFARKFSDKSSNIVDALDQIIMKRDQ